MFKLFKSIFGKKERIKLSGEELLASWPMLKSQRLGEAKARLSRYKSRASSAIEELENRVAALQSMSIAERDIGGQITSCSSCSIPGRPNSPNRIIHIAEGNKERYVSVLFDFIFWLKSWQGNLDKPNPKLCLDFEAQLNNLGVKTRKNYAVLSETIGQKASVVLESLSKLNKLNGKIKTEIGRFEITRMAQIDGSLEELERLKDKIEELGQKEESLGVDAEKVTKELASESKELEKIKTGWEIAELNQIKIDGEKASQNIENLESKIKGFFSKYQKGLKKYLHKNPSGLQSYLGNPISALEDDAELKIIGLFVELKKELGELALTEKQKTEIGLVKPECLRELKQNLVAARRKRMELLEKEKVLRESEKMSQMREQEETLRQKMGALDELEVERREVAARVASAVEKLGLRKQKVEAEIREFVGAA